jgi:hypothetical protein
MLRRSLLDLVLTMMTTLPVDLVIDVTRPLRSKSRSVFMRFSWSSLLSRSIVISYTLSSRRWRCRISLAVFFLLEIVQFRSTRSTQHPNATQSPNESPRGINSARVNVLSNDIAPSRPRHLRNCLVGGERPITDAADRAHRFPAIPHRAKPKGNRPWQGHTRCQLRRSSAGPL